MMTPTVERDGRSVSRNPFSTILPLVGLAVVLVGLTGCGGKDDGAGKNPNSAATGPELFRATCTACHGQQGEGVEGQGRDIRSSEFIQGQDDAALVAFIKLGREADHPDNTTGILMPPKGGNPTLQDEDLLKIIAFLRSWQVPVTPAQ